ncbi:Dihydroorotate dehydrogenase B (NAD(+)), electron transfer subunit [Sporomusa acidovorans DSM 3132]|uniref:Dihydroorotate dehydrogenase B (NAD(+)), electron transfer subunit n=2 Tax=Sporomusa TaxID=2375 RepID=A0ABZ3J571_SPOA4|nr:dihydroorotate dehydrogenase electron transfer subunit [Sporomusa acidovorans]OZC23080.1 dihydroorotate dehydrogenase B (NAD(+)), electron transfer subunit [Sporomusa acidovorans DSM 3132]SDF04696.1 dihydroorotate dehydrogenase electron transfer subunit [Sporomusa acidovorans]
MTKTCAAARVIEHSLIAGDVWKMVVVVPEIAATTRPGQFVHIRLTDTLDPLLRRPFSIADCNAAQGTLTLIYRVVGRGTALMTKLKPGDTLSCMGPLGNGFDLAARRPLLVGGGMGLAPLLFLARAFCSCPATVLMGGRNDRELFWPELYAGVCQNFHITSDDGSIGHRGFTVDLLPELLERDKFDIVYACGPHAMLKGVAAITAEYDVPCQVSLEDYMACGVGACLSCTCASTSGKRHKVCTDGPVFPAGEVVW